jgi:hypothetical protein
VLKKLQAHIRPNPIGEPNSQTAIITDRGRFDLFSRLTTATGCQRISIASDFFGSSLMPSFAILEAEPTDPRPERNDDPHAYERDGRSVQDFSPGPGRVERDLNYRKSHHKHRVKPSENDRNTPQYPYPCGVFSAVFVRQIDVVRWSAHAVILAAASAQRKTPHLKAGLVQLSLSLRGLPIRESPSAQSSSCQRPCLRRNKAGDFRRLALRRAK